MTREKLTLDANSCKSLREIVFETIRTAIVQGNLKPGERLMEVQLAQELGVSRTPVRESIRKLELEGLVKMIPRKGAYVTPLSIKDLKEMMQIREALESLVAELAAENATEEEVEAMRKSNRGFEDSLRNGDEDGIIDYDITFHEILYKASRNERLCNMIHTLREQMQRVRVEYVHNVDDKLPLIGQHRAIIDNVARHNPEEAAKYAAKHITVTEENMVEVLDNKDA
jgi:DNA-binding GntR family transcriptional regulator